MNASGAASPYRLKTEAKVATYSASKQAFCCFFKFAMPTFIYFSLLQRSFYQKKTLTATANEHFFFSPTIFFDFSFARFAKILNFATANPF